MPAPRFLASLMSMFPPIEYDDQEATSASSGSDTYPAQPASPTLWIYGPGINDELESFDLACLRAQAEAAFRGVKVETRILQVAEGAPGASLPTLHLPNGDLIATDGVHDWIVKASAAKTISQVEKQDDLADGKHDEEDLPLEHRTYLTLVQSKLQPALLSHLFLMPMVFNNLTTTLYHPQTIPFSTATVPAAPILTRIAHGALAKSHKLEAQAEIQKLLNITPTSSWRVQLNVEDIQRGGEEAIELLAGKLADDGKGWFFGSEKATELDAVLYANLHLIHLLHAPRLGAPSPLRKKLEKYPSLSRWARRLHQEHFLR